MIDKSETSLSKTGRVAKHYSIGSRPIELSLRCTLSKLGNHNGMRLKLELGKKPEPDKIQNQSFGWGIQNSMILE